MKKIILILLMVFSPLVQAATVADSLGCTAPTTYTDGSPIQDPITFKFYCAANDAPAYVGSDVIGSTTGQCALKIPAVLSDGVKKCVVTATVLGVDSAYSNEVRLLVKGGVPYMIGPNQPSGLKIMPAGSLSN